MRRYGVAPKGSLLAGYTHGGCSTHNIDSFRSLDDFKKHDRTHKGTCMLWWDRETGRGRKK
mgnify:CR=1 FL=1